MGPNRVIGSIPTFLMLLLGISISFLLCLYSFQQQALILEGNHLYSNDAKLVQDIPFEQLLSLAHESGSDARIFAKYNDQKDVIAVFSANYEALPFPLFQGKGLSNNTEDEALVGASVETRTENGKEYIEQDGKLFSVAGRLGSTAHSPLQNSIVLKFGSSTSSEKLSNFVVDGAFDTNRAKSESPQSSFEPLNQGVSKRTSIDTVSPLLMGGGLLAVLLSLSIAGLLHAQSKRREISLLTIKGEQRLHLQIRYALHLEGMVLLALLPVAALALSAGKQPSIEAVAGIFLIGLTIPAAVFTISTSALKGDHNA